MKYKIYYHNEVGHRMVEFDRVSNLEKFITLGEDKPLTFHDHHEAGAVFFRDRQEIELGFYMEEEV